MSTVFTLFLMDLIFALNEQIHTEYSWRRRIEHLLAIRNWNRSRLASVLGCPWGTVHRWLSGTTPSPAYRRQIEAMERACGIGENEH